jgi:hypothetical protein
MRPGPSWEGGEGGGWEGGGGGKFICGGTTENHGFKTATHIDFYRGERGAGKDILYSVRADRGHQESNLTPRSEDHSVANAPRRPHSDI